MAKKEYIERGAVFAELAKLKKENEYADGDDRYPFVYGALTGVRQSETYVKAIPAADVVEVVRCKDCLIYKPISESCGNCWKTNTIMHPDDFCSRAKWKKATP